MLRLPPFTYLAPQSIAEAVRLKAEHGADAMFVAGGSVVYAGMKRGQFEPKVLVALHGIEGLARGTGGGARGVTLRCRGPPPRPGPPPGPCRGPPAWPARLSCARRPR